MALYAPEAVFVANDGRTITDRAEFTAILEHDIKLGLPLKANVRHVFVGGDTAQIVLDWSIDGTAALQTGVDDRRHLVKLPSLRVWTCAPEFSGRRRMQGSMQNVAPVINQAHPGGMLQLAFFAA